MASKTKTEERKTEQEDLKRVVPAGTMLKAGGPQRDGQSRDGHDGHDGHDGQHKPRQRAKKGELTLSNVRLEEPLVPHLRGKIVLDVVTTSAGDC